MDNSESSEDEEDVTLLHICIRDDENPREVASFIIAESQNKALCRTRIPKTNWHRAWIQLLEHQAVWVDEWVRRGSGDYYINVTRMSQEEIMNICLQFREIRCMRAWPVFGVFHIPDDLE